MKRRKHQKFRSRGGIRLPAAITLCLALSLLIFSRAGGEPIAQKALTGLARNSGFVTRAMALEFGVSPDDTAEVYTPRTAAAARDEQAENPLAESTYVPSSDTENDNPVLSAADKLPRSPSTTRPRMTWMRQTVWPQTSIFPLMEMGAGAYLSHTQQRKLHAGCRFSVYTDRDRAHDRYQL
mgnify:CR=1 FL=1